MSRPVPGNSVLEVTFVGDGNSGKLLNVWHYKLDNVAAAVDGDAITTLLRAQIQPAAGGGVLESMCNMCHETVTWRHIRYQWITPIRYTPITDTTGGGNGTHATQALPMNVCGVLTLRTLFAGRSGLGRKHFGGLSVTDVNAGTMTPLWQANVTPVSLVMTLPVNLTPVQPGLTLQAVVFHRAAPELSHTIAGYQTQETARVMRRRTLFVGE